MVIASIFLPLSVLTEAYYIRYTGDDVQTSPGINMTAENPATSGSGGHHLALSHTASAASTPDSGYNEGLPKRLSLSSKTGKVQPFNYSNTWAKLKSYNSRYLSPMRILETYFVPYGMVCQNIWLESR